MTLEEAQSATSRDSGMSHAARVVRNQLYQAQSAYFDPNKVLTQIRAALLDRVFDACQSASEPGWDGYDALPVTSASYEQARRLVETLPAAFLNAEVGIDPDGEVALEWRAGPRWIFSVSIGTAGVLSYAGIFGVNRTHGTERSLETIPGPVADALGRIDRRHNALQLGSAG